MDKKKIEKYRQLLLEKRAEVAGELSNLRKEGMKGVEDGPMDSGDDATFTYNKQVSLNLSEAERSLLREIDEALDRLDSGEYGSCETCGDKIAEARLKALPYASLCIDCKSEEESRGR